MTKGVRSIATFRRFLALSLQSLVGAGLFVIRAFVIPSSFVIRHSSFAPLPCSCSQPTPAFADTNVPGSDALLRLRPPRGEIPPTFWERNSGWIMAAGLLLLVAIAAARLVAHAAQAAGGSAARRAGTQGAGAAARTAGERGRAEPGLANPATLRGAAFALPPGEMTTADFCRAIAGQARVGDELSSALSDFLRNCDERKFAPAAAP